MSVFQIIGIIGFISYVSGYAAVQFGFLDGNSLLFSLTNICSASLVLISLTETFNLASALIQISWICIGITGILLRLNRQKKSISAPVPRQQQS